MNIEIYSMKNAKSNKSFQQKLPQLMAQLNRKNMYVLYTTEIDNDPESLIKAISSSKKSEEKVDTVIVLNAYDSKKSGSVHNVLCQLSGAEFTPAKKLLSELDGDTAPNYAGVIRELAASGEDHANAFSLGDMGNGCEAFCFFCKGIRIITLPDSAASGTDEQTMIKEAIENAALRAPLPDSAVAQSGLSYQIEDISGKKKSGKKRGFIKSVIPMKGDRPAEVIRKLILIAASLTFIVTAGFLINSLVIQPMLEDNMMNDLKDIVSTNVSSRVTVAEANSKSKDKNKSKKKATQSHDWDELQGINKEAVAWVQIPGTTFLNYPVMYHKGDDIDNQYYLYRDIYQNYSGYGSVFIDWRSTGGVKAKNIILHGHHMRDGRMFQNLMGYGTFTGDLDFYSEHPIIYFDTPAGDSDWKIISVYKTNTLDEHGDYFDYLTGEFSSDAEFMNYVYLIRERSLIDCPVDVNEDDQLLSLSTCSYEYNEFRTVVVARKCRPGESSKVDVKKATINSDALWPDVYYGGGAKPKVTSFSKAYKAGEIDWYDGKGNLKGRERNFTLHDAADAAIAADDEDSPSVSETKIKEKGISFNMDKMTLDNGASSRLTVLWNPDNVADKTITWRTSNVNVADIDADGVVYAMGPGTATITAESKYGYTATCEVNINQPVATLYLDYTSYNFYQGTTIQLTAWVTPSNATDPTLKWSSDNPAIATVDKKGLVKGIAPGQTVIRVRTSNGIEMTCDVNVMPVAQNVG